MKLKILITLIFFILSIEGHSVSSAKNNLIMSEKNNELIKNKIEKSPYLIGPGDVIEIIFFGAEELTSTYYVLSDGTISLPFVGSVDLDNLSLKEARNILRDLFSKELLNPELNIRIVKSRPIRVSIIGEIKNPGIYIFNKKNSEKISDQSNEVPTIIDAIQKAGGISTNANLTNLTLERKLSGSKGDYKFTNLNLLSIILEGDLSQNLYLHDGDRIILNKTTSNNKNINAAVKTNLSPEIISITILGAVKNEGELKLRSSSTISQAIIKAGGFKALKSNNTKIDLIRLNSDGSATIESYKFDKNLISQNSKNPILEDGDIIRVGKNIFGKTTNSINSISEPFSGLLPIITLIKLF